MGKILPYFFIFHLRHAWMESVARMGLVTSIYLVALFSLHVYVMQVSAKVALLNYFDSFTDF